MHFPDDSQAVHEGSAELARRLTEIRNLITRNVVDQRTRLILVNAVYFKGRWAEPFSESATRPDKSFAGAGRELQVPFMNRSGDFRYGEDSTVQVLELPYAGGELSMVILLPKSRRGLAALEQKLRRENLQGWLQKLRRDEVRVSLPKFRFECAFRLDDSLKALGMRDAFDPHDADFSGMDGRIHWLYIYAALHKAFIEVNEEGTEAAAATGVVMHAESLRVPGPPVFRADHPFLFLIRERATGCILFLGRVVKPKGT